jgi:hypothetical protein
VMIEENEIPVEILKSEIDVGGDVVVVKLNCEDSDDEEFLSSKDDQSENFDEFEEFANYVSIVSNSFHCQLCPKIYQKRNITVKHLRAEHNIVLASYNYDNANRYRKPQKELEWKCRFCPRRYTSKRVASRHENLHGAAGDLLHKCSCCSQHFRAAAEMKAHQNAEHEERLKCKVEGCGKRFDHPEKVVSHTKYAHKEGREVQKKYTFVCQLCGK